MSLIATLGAISAGVNVARSVAEGVSAVREAVGGRTVAPVSASPGFPGAQTIRQAGFTTFTDRRNGAVNIPGVTSIGPTPIQGTAIVPLVRGFRGMAGLITGAVGGAIAEILARSRENTGRAVSKNAIITTAKNCGIELAAETFGISEKDVCIIISAGRTRRRRGISARDISNCNRVARRITTFQRNLKKATGRR